LREGFGAVILWQFCCIQVLDVFEAAVDLLFKSTKIHWSWGKWEFGKLGISQVRIVNPKAVNLSFEEIKVDWGVIIGVIGGIISQVYKIFVRALC